MKRIAVVLLFLMLTILCGCRKTPDAHIVSSGTQEDILEKVEAACVFETPYHVAIDRAKLCYLMVARKDSDEYLPVPAWCFFGTNAEYAPTQALVLAINAIDSTIIDGGYGE